MESNYVKYEDDLRVDEECLIHGFKDVDMRFVG